MGRHDRADRIEHLFEQAARLPSESRQEFLDRACRDDDPALRREVESLLHADQRAGSFLSPLLEPDGDESADGKSMPTGKIIGSYQILAKLGEGGMGSVFLAARADDQYDQRVALKLVPQALASAEHQRRFHIERQILASLEHPNICRILDAGTTDDGVPYFVMELVEGEPIDVYCNSQGLSIRERLELFRTACSAVHYAHQNLIVHRDLKPSNLLVTKEGVPKLLDFGIAKLLNPELAGHGLQPTLAWQRLLTPDYASPEQILGRGITTASDVYSLGALLYQLLTGRLPLDLSGKDAQTLEQVVATRVPVPPSVAIANASAVESIASTGGSTGEPSVPRAWASHPSSWRRRLKGDLDRIVLMALRKEPRRRYSSAEELSEDIRRHLAGLPVMARQDTAFYRAGKFLRRHRLGVGVASAFFLLLATAAWLLAQLAFEVSRQRDRARLERDKAQQVTQVLGRIFEASNPFSELNDGPTPEISARELIDRSVEVVRRDLQSQPEVRAALMNILGNVYRHLGLYPKAHPLLEEALEIRREILGPAHADIADSLDDLAELARQRGDYQQAKERFRQAIEMRQVLFGGEHLALTRSQRGLALALTAEGRFEEAEAMQRQALVSQQRLLGGEDPEISGSLLDLGTILMERGEHQKAERLFRQSLEMRRRLQGEDHPEVARGLYQLAQALWYGGQFDHAEPLYHQALERIGRIVGEDHPLMADVLTSFALQLQAQGRFEQARRLHLKSLAAKRRYYGEQHQSVLIGLNNLASLHTYEKDFETAYDYYREALALARNIMPADHPGLAYVLIGFGACKMELGQAATAEASLREGLAIRQSRLPEGHWLTAYAESFLGQCLTRLGRYEEAEPLVMAGFEKTWAERNPGDQEPQRTLRAVIELFDAMGQPERAAPYRALLSVPDGPSFPNKES